MNLSRFILPMLLLLALIGAPFGMGRMMDKAPGHAPLHQAHEMAAMMPGMDHGPTPSHKDSTPHFMVCAASVAVSPPVPDALLLGFKLETFRPAVLAELDGIRFLPPVPPPRA
jgi:hypothetical protein